MNYIKGDYKTYDLWNEILKAKRQSSSKCGFIPSHLQKEQDVFYKGKHIFKMHSSLNTLHHSIQVSILMHK